MKIKVYYLLDRRSKYKRSKQVSLLCDVKYAHEGAQKNFRFSTGIRVSPKNFVRQAILPGEPNCSAKSETLKLIKVAAESIYYTSLVTGKLPDPAHFKEQIRKEVTTVPTIKTVADHYDDYLAALAAKKKSYSFISAMTNLKKMLIELQGGKRSTLTFESIDLNFETRFRELMNDRGYAHNTVAANIRRLKMFMNWAFRNNLHTNFIYKQYEMKELAGDIVALDENEIQKIADLSIPAHKHIRHGGTKLVRDWFLISCECGLRYSDFHKIANPELIQVDGGYDVRVTTRKTREKVTIPISQRLYDIFEEYGFSVPLPPSNQKYNGGLDRIAALARLTKEISSHTGRKSYCTNMFKRGVPVPTIMRVSGHRTEKEFYKYIDMTGEQNAQNIRKHDEQMKERYTIVPKMAVNR